MNELNGPLQQTMLPLTENLGVLELLHSGLPWDSMVFWDSYKGFLESNGVFLYKETRSFDGYRIWDNAEYKPILQSATFTFPFLPTTAHTEKDFDCLNGHVAPARDIYNRELVIKLIDNDSEEFFINTFFLNREEFRHPSTLPCILPPVKIIPSPHNFSFLIMPRWTRYFWYNSVPNVGEALNLIRCLLKGLDYLHEHRIVHRDISDANILKDIGAEDSAWMQGLPKYPPLPSYDGRPRDFRTRYCLFDFNLALKLPPETSLRDCRISAVGVDGWGTYWAHPQDIAQGEYEYNPFAFDVACLGNVIHSEFFHAIPSIPLVIPLLDRMTTHVVSQRFTAAQALSFWDEAIQSIPRTEWETPVPERDTSIAIPTLDEFWDNFTPSGFAETWKMYRSPPVPLMTRVLRWICTLNSYRAKSVVRFIRYHLKL